MAAAYDIFTSAKDFINFSAEDEANLRSLGPVFARHGAAITDAFYGTLARFPATAKLIEGRVDMLKATHHRWMGELFAGDYGETYFHNRVRIGMVHVKVGIDPVFVECVCSLLRVAGHEAMRKEIPDTEELSRKFASYCKIIDLDLILINLAYNEERLDRLSAVTGMRRNLIENLVKARK